MIFVDQEGKIKHVIDEVKQALAKISASR